MTPSILVDRVSKQYQIGGVRQGAMLREALVNWARHPFRSHRGKKNTIWALRDVSFTVGAGEVIGIIGRNGAGKSTLLRALTKITYPTSGTVKVIGRVASLLEVGSGFHEELTGRENIYLNGSILGMKKKEIDAKLDAIVDYAGVEKFIDTQIKHYSSGMRLRLGFAVAAHLDTDVLLVDEILAVGDVEFQKKCLTTMDKLHRAGRTVVFVSHNLLAIENFCPRTIWIDRGQVREDGETREIIRAYLANFATHQESGSTLAELDHREGSGDIRYTRIEFLTSDGQPKSTIQSGDSLVVRLHYHAKQRIREPFFGIRIHTHLGTLVTDFSSWSTGLQIPFLSPGDGQIDSQLSFLNLMPGRYSISLWLVGTDTAGRGLWINYDIVEHCAMLDVESSDFYGSGRGIHPQFGIVFLPCRWMLTSQNETGESPEACLEESQK